MGVNAVLFVIIVFTCLLLSHIFKRRKFYYLPDSSAALVVGFAVGLGLLAVGSEAFFSAAFFRQELFYYVLLPPIVLDAGLGLEKGRFFSNVASILLFAVLGTLVSTIVVGYGLYALACVGVLGLETASPLEALMFGALISAVDPVATLAILANKHVNADKLLLSLVFGESVLNDAVSIVLFNTLREFYTSTDASIGDMTLRDVIVRFLVIALGSVGVGIVTALSCSLLLRRTAHLPETHEFAVLFLFSYGSYAAAEVAGLSGVMSLFFCGMAMSHYAWYNMSRNSRVATVSAFKAFALVSETFLFAYLGMAAVVSVHPTFHLHWSLAMIVCTMLLCLLSRALNIFPLAALANLGRRRPIPVKMQLVMWFAGLRGAIAFALAMGTPTENSSTIVTTTMVIVIATSLVCGGLTEPLLSRLGLKQPAPEGGGVGAAGAADGDSSDGNEADGWRDSAASLAYTLVSASAHRVLPERYWNTVDDGIGSVWRRMDREFLQPLFGGAVVAAREREAREQARRAAGSAEPSPLHVAMVRLPTSSASSAAASPAGGAGASPTEAASAGGVHKSSSRNRFRAVPEEGAASDGDVEAALSPPHGSSLTYGGSAPCSPRPARSTRQEG